MLRSELVKGIGFIINQKKNFDSRVPTPLSGHRRFREKGRITADEQAASSRSSPVEGKDVKTLKLGSSISLIVWMVLSLWLVPAPGDAQQKLRVALGSVSVNSSVIPIGAQHGLFAKYGVDVEPIYFGGGMNSIAALTSNSVQLLAAGSTATIGARVGGIDIVMLAVQSNKLDYSVLVAPDVKVPQDLKGKIVTGTRTGASADTALRLYLQRHGLVPDKDVVFISVADSQQGRFNALVRSVVAGTVLPPPYSTVAKQQGFRELADLRKTDIEYSGTSIAGIGSYIKAHSAEMEGFLKGYIESLNFFRTQKEKSVAGIMKYMRISDRARAEEGYDYYVDMMPVMPYASNAGVKAVLQFLGTRNPKALSANPEEFYDHSFLKKIEESGFSKQFAARR
jgi:ABC-type nitrate/sulfonate/bicarbonate transport system substrate-binding protein